MKTKRNELKRLPKSNEVLLAAVRLRFTPEFFSDFFSITNFISQTWYYFLLGLKNNWRKTRPLVRVKLVVKTGEFRNLQVNSVQSHLVRKGWQRLWKKAHHCRLFALKRQHRSRQTRNLKEIYHCRTTVFDKILWLTENVES